MTSIINSKCHSTPFISWQSIDWKRINGTVKKIRGSIYKAKQNDKLKLVRRLQDIMLRSDANILLSIRKITAINAGKKTPGIDNTTAMSNEARWNIFLELKKTSRREWADEAKPVKRIYIPKPNGNFRPLGIPTIKDRIIQNMVKNALEPEWEAVFETSSYGFRPGRSCHDALSRVYLATARQKKKLWVLDADIKGCFDNINHETLLQIIGNFPENKIIMAWLKAGYCEFPNEDVVEPKTGTPQGGVISPLLANIALHGMEQILGIKTISTTGHNYGTNTYTLIRYADDFLVLAATKEQCIKAKELLEPWLKNRGLEFAPEKVHITHLREGIKFLGCSIKLYGKINQKLLIKPHPESVTALKKRLKELWLKYKGQAPHVIIKQLNPIIRGWANYYKPWVSSEVFASLDHIMWHRAWRFAKRRHPHKNHTWIAEKYFGTQEGFSQNKWRFFGLWGNTKLFLLKFSDFKITRHVMVKNNMDPDNPAKKVIAYWDKRTAHKQKQVWANYESRMKLAKKQYHICPICNESLYNDEELHVHHIKPKKLGGLDTYGNLTILHEMCHRQVHSLKLKEADVRTALLNLRQNMKTKLNAPK